MALKSSKENKTILQYIIRKLTKLMYNNRPRTPQLFRHARKYFNYSCNVYYRALLKAIDIIISNHHHCQRILTDMIYSIFSKCVNSDKGKTLRA